MKGPRQAMNAISKAIASGDTAALTEALRADIQANHLNIPDALKQLKAWLVWRVGKIDPARGKFGKVPVYPNSGRNRSGAQGSPEDCAGLGTWEQAFAVFQRDTSLAGVGIAMLPEFGLVALDADKCVSQQDGRPSIADQARALCGSTYTEISPSGSGVRAFWLGTAQDGKNHAAGFELFHAKGFVTITGSHISGEGIESLSDEHRARLQSLVAARGLVTQQAQPERTELARLTEEAAGAAALPEIREALFFIPADDRDTWIRMGHALKTVGERAADLWHEWSATSPKYDREDAHRVWHSFKPNQTGRGPIFAEAKEHGWQPRAGIASSPDTVASRTVRADVLAASSFKPLDWTVPDILPEGLAILAGRPKAGKSFFAMQLALSVASGDLSSLGLGQIAAGDVLYLALEDSRRRLRERQLRMCEFCPPSRLLFATDWPRIGMGAIKALQDWYDTQPNPRLIIIDTLRAIKAPSSGRRSAYDEDASSVAPLLDFTRGKPGLACLIVHHTRKMEAEDPFDTISGTLGLTGIFDTLMVLSRSGSGTTMLAAQGRDLEPYEKAMQRDLRTGGWTITRGATLSAKTGERQELLDILKQSSAPTSLADLARAVGKQPDTTRRLLKGLMDEGSVRQPRHGTYALTDDQSPQLAQCQFSPSIF